MPSLRSTLARFTPHLPLAALILLAVYPILSGSLPTTGDGLNHFYRFAELNWHIGQGDFYPRWFSNLHFGYGAPLFNFYAPLSYYIPLIFRILGLSLETSLQLGYVLALAVAMVGAYRWGQSLFEESPFAPLLIAAAYGLAPYFYLNIFHRSAYPETWALAFAPWLLWAAHKLVVQPGSRTALFSFIFFLSAIIITHTLSALILLPIASLYFLLLLATRRPITNYPLPLSRFALAVILSLALTAFFTLPVLFESQFIQLNRTYSTGDLDYHRNFLSLATLLSAPPNYDPLLVFNSMPPSLGWPQVLLAVLAILVVIKNHKRRSAIWTLGLLTFVVCILPLGLTEPLWNLFPFSRFIQFPWRLVGPASLLVAVLGAQAVTLSEAKSLWGGLSKGEAQRVSNPYSVGTGESWPRSALLIAAATASFFFFSLSWTYHADFGLNAPASNSPADSIRYEIANGQLGTSSTGEYLPRDVAELPDPQAVLSQFTDTSSRLVALPAEVTYTASRLSPTSETVTYTAPAPLTLTYNLFYFPGWVATVDNAPVNIQPSPLHGLITINVPAGTHTLNLYRQFTPPQWIGILISLATLAGLLIYNLRAIVRRTATPQIVSINPPLRLTGIVSLFILVLLASRILYFDRTETIFHHTRPVPNPTSVNFDNQLELMGYDYTPQLISGETLPVTIYWKAIQPLTKDYSVSVQLADSLGNRFGQSDSQHPNDVPTSRWHLEQYARDTHLLSSLNGTPPGNYELRITVYSNTPLSILQDGSPVGVEYTLGTVQVTAPSPQGSGPLSLSSAELASNSVQVGDSLTLTAQWYTGDAPLPPLTARIFFADEMNGVLYYEELPPSGPGYPTEQWAPNTPVRYPLSVTLPATLAGGEAHVWLALMEANGRSAAGPYDLGPVRIIEPERSFEIPTIQVRIDHDFGGAIRLLGYDLGEETTTLYWQSLEALPRRLTVFIHGLDANGTFVYGHDAQPARPTTSWLPGEVITDVHPIVITDRFEVGLYEPMTGVRFGETFVTRR